MSPTETTVHACHGTDDDGRPLTPERVICGNCGRSWCERCDPAPSALCHWCHGRGYSDAELEPEGDLPEYSGRDPRGWMGDPSRGAAMGRPTVHGAEPEGRIIVRRSPLDRQGYDRNGTYFGAGQPLYWYADEGGEVDAVTRAADMDEAIALVRDRYPEATIQPAPALVLPCWGFLDDGCPDKANAATGEDTYAGLLGDMCETCAIWESDVENGEATCARCKTDIESADGVSINGDGEMVCKTCTEDDDDA